MRRYSLVRNDGRIWISGRISATEVSAASLRRSFADVAPDGPLSVVIDTPGGSCAEGLAIYTALRECGRPVAVTIQCAFSMGAIIAAAGHTVAIDPHGAIGLHPSGVSGMHEAIGGIDPTEHVTADRLRRYARALWSDDRDDENVKRAISLAECAEATDATHLDILARRTRLPRDELRALRADWSILDAERAVALGFADRIVPLLEENL